MNVIRRTKHVILFFLSYACTVSKWTQNFTCVAFYGTVIYTNLVTYLSPLTQSLLNASRIRRAIKTIFVIFVDPTLLWPVSAIDFLKHGIKILIPWAIPCICSWSNRKYDGLFVHVHFVFLCLNIHSSVCFNIPVKETHTYFTFELLIIIRHLFR